MLFSDTSASLTMRAISSATVGISDIRPTGCPMVSNDIDSFICTLSVLTNSFISYMII